MRFATLVGIAFLGFPFCFIQPSYACAMQSSCEQQLRDALGHYNNKRYVQALRVLDAMSGCSDSLRFQAEDLRVRIAAGQKCGNFADEILRSEKYGHDYVCRMLVDFEASNCSDPRIDQLKYRIGPCNLMPPEADQLHEEILLAVENKNLREARRKYQILLSKYPSYPGIVGLLNEIHELAAEIQTKIGSKESAASPQNEGQREVLISNPPNAIEKGKTTDGKNDAASAAWNDAVVVPIDRQKPVESAPNVSHYQGSNTNSHWDYYSAALRYFEKKEYFRARSSAQEAMRYKSEDGQTRSLLAQIEEKIKSERLQISKAIDLFYGGQHDECYRLLTNLIASKEISPQGAALCEFYLGANYSTLFFLGGGKDEHLRDRAMVYFRQAVSTDPGFHPPEQSISQRILQLFAEAAKLQKTP